MLLSGVVCVPVYTWSWHGISRIVHAHQEAFYFILFYFTFKFFLRSAKKAELEENQRSYKQKKKRRRIKVQEDSSSENKVIMAFIVCLNYYSPIILYFIVNSPFLFVFHSVITFYYLNFTIIERIICSFLFPTFSKKVFNSFLICYFIHI